MKIRLVLLLLISCIAGSAQIPGITASSMKYAAPSGDADAAAFKTATGITGTNAQAIDSLVKWLKDSSLWDKSQVIYPVAGGNSTAHSYNLKNVSTFQLQFNGGWTHSATGMKPNGSTGFAKTGWIPSVQCGSQHLTSAGIYTRTNVEGSYVDLGVQSADNIYYQIYTMLYSNAYISLNSYGSGMFIASTSSSGWFFGAHGTQSGTANNFSMRNAVTASADYPAYQIGVPNLEVYLGARNEKGTAGGFSSREISFVWISNQPLSIAEASTLYNIIQKYQTLLSRKV